MAETSVAVALTDTWSPLQLWVVTVNNIMSRYFWELQMEQQQKKENNSVYSMFSLVSYGIAKRKQTRKQLNFLITNLDSFRFDIENF